MSKLLFKKKKKKTSGKHEEDERGKGREKKNEPSVNTPSLLPTPVDE